MYTRDSFIYIGMVLGKVRNGLQVHKDAYMKDVLEFYMELRRLKFSKDPHSVELFKIY